MNVTDPNGSTHQQTDRNTARPWHAARRLALASEVLIPWIHSQSQLSGSRTSTPSRILDSAPSAGPWPNRPSAYQLRSASSQQPDNPASACAKSCNRTTKLDDIRNVYHFSPQSISIFVCFPPLALRLFPSLASFVSYHPPFLILFLSLLLSSFLCSASQVPLFPHPGFTFRPPAFLEPSIASSLNRSSASTEAVSQNYRNPFKPPPPR
ncbi:hypothetical protein VTI28DRAFT_502 [Corynascus sepedonium]